MTKPVWIWEFSVKCFTSPNNWPWKKILQQNICIQNQSDSAKPYLCSLGKKLKMWDIFVVGQLRFNRRHQNSMEKMIKRRWQNTSPKGGKTGMSQLYMPYMPLLSIIYISIRCVYVHHILYQVIPLWIPPFLRWFYDFLELCFPPTKREHLRSRSHRF